MSITNTLFPNEIDLRARKSIFEEVWTKALDSEEYVRLVPGGGGTPGELPYYLKANSIKVDGEEGSETLVTSNLVSTQASEATTSIFPTAVSVENFGNSTGTELTSTALTFGDINGNSTLTKPGVATVSRLQTMESAAVLNNGAGTFPLVFNPATKAFNQTRNITLLSADGNNRTNITTASLRNDMPNNSARYFMSGISSGVTHNEVNYRLYAGAFASGIVHRNLNTNKGIVAKEDSFTVGDVNFDAISTTGNYGKLAESSLSFKDSSGTVVLNKDDIGVTNKLKALTAATSGANSKMLIYDTGTSAFNYTDLTSAGTIPVWVTTPQALFTQTISGVGKEETTLAGTGLKVFYGSLFNDSTQVTVDDDSVELRKTTTSGVNGAYKSLRIDSTGVRLVKKNNGPIATSPEVVTTLVAGIVRDVVYASSFAHLTSSFLIVSGSPKCRQYSLAEGETLVLDCFGDATGGIHINEWYAVNLGNQPGSTIIQGFITPAVTLQNHGYLLFMRNKDPITSGSVTIPAGSVIFKIVNTGISAATPFNGSLCFKMVCSDTSKLPTAPFTEL